MSVFFDTNLLVYAQQHGDKADRARALLAGGGALSVQVINEFAAVAHRKQGKDWEAIEEAIDDVLVLVGALQSLTLATHKAARAQGFAFYDAPIIAAALEAGCDTLFSEDMQNGRKIGALTIVNPIHAGGPTDRSVELPWTTGLVAHRTGGRCFGMERPTTPSPSPRVVRHS